MLSYRKYGRAFKPRVDVYDVLIKSLWWFTRSYKSWLPINSLASSPILPLPHLAPHTMHALQLRALCLLLHCLTTLSSLRYLLSFFPPSSIGSNFTSMKLTLLLYLPLQPLHPQILTWPYWISIPAILMKFFFQRSINPVNFS